MNKTRRREVKEIINLIEAAKTRLETAASEERDYFDNMPENLQDSERGMETERAADTLEEAVSALDEILAQCQEVIE